jgi:hypothetical protein
LQAYAAACSWRATKNVEEFHWSVLTWAETDTKTGKAMASGNAGFLADIKPGRYYLEVLLVLIAKLAAVKL